MNTVPTPDPLHDNYRYNGEDEDAARELNVDGVKYDVYGPFDLGDGWRQLPEPTACEGHTHRYYNNEDKCVCGRGPDLSKRRMR